jgi:hypothetical protein
MTYLSSQHQAASADKYEAAETDILLTKIHR